MKRTTQGTYAALVLQSEVRALGTEDYEARIEGLEKDLTRQAKEANEMFSELHVANAMIQDLEALVELAAQKPLPREPDIVILTADQPGVSGGLASVQEACAWISERGSNLGRPCIRPAEPNQKHAKGRHRYS